MTPGPVPTTGLGSRKPTIVHWLALRYGRMPSPRSIKTPLHFGGHEDSSPELLPLTPVTCGPGLLTLTPGGLPESGNLIQQHSSARSMGLVVLPSWPPLQLAQGPHAQRAFSNQPTPRSHSQQLGEKAVGPQQSWGQEGSAQ